MNWRGNEDLSKWFIPFLFGWALLIGEILPVCFEQKDCFPEATPPGAKESMFSSLDMLIPTIILYALLSTLFWFLFRKLNWKVIVIIAATLGAAMEFSIFKPQEEGLNVIENPAGALLFFIIIWPILLVLPYAIFTALTRWRQRRSLP